MADSTSEPSLQIVEHGGWYKNPYKWLDHYEILAIAGTETDKDKRIAAKWAVIELLRDRGTYRPIELQIFIRLFIKALNNLNVEHVLLTKQQMRTKKLLEQAIAHGLVPSHYIADQENITVRAAQYRLQRKNIKEILEKENKRFVFEDLLSLDDIRPELEYAPIPEHKIRSVMKRLRVRCAGDGLEDCWGWAWGNMAVCPSCWKKAKSSSWLEEHRRFVFRESYARAKAIIERGDDSERANTNYERFAEAA